MLELSVTMVEWKKKVELKRHVVGFSHRIWTAVAVWFATFGFAERLKIQLGLCLLIHYVN